MFEMSSLEDPEMDEEGGTVLCIALVLTRKAAQAAALLGS
jgi:hypothetical protein